MKLWRCSYLSLWGQPAHSPCYHIWYAAIPSEIHCSDQRVLGNWPRQTLTKSHNSTKGGSSEY
jgi:hypothetical protein